LLRGTAAAVAGPTLAGLSIAAAGLPFTFVLDAATFAVSLLALSAMRAVPPAAEAQAPGIASVLEGLRYAASRPELIGTYVVDFVAVSLAMPVALFPALASQWSSANAAGYLYSATSAGALIATLLSGWTRKVERRGAAVVIAAALWGAAIAALGYARSLPVALVCLVLAGAADMVSGLFRMTIWNETIPSHLRGRMAGIEQISYMSGPLLGNARAGIMAQRFGLAPAITWGGIACVACVAACVPILPAFWRYRAPKAPEER
jgi:MFS family permease